jgi:CheY-like chemotaxis protein
LSTPVPIRVLILEDNAADAELMVIELRKAGLDAQAERVETAPEFAARLVPEPDLILSDIKLPQYCGVEALRLVRSRRLEVPFIIVSGTIGEDVAVEAMREGADDYLLKDRMARLGPAALQALEKRRVCAELRRAEMALRETDVKFREIAASVRDLF